MKVRLTNPLHLSRRRLGWLIIGGVAVIAAATTGTILLVSSDDHSSTEVTTTDVQRGTVEMTVSAAGTVQTLQSRSLGFSMSGTVVELNVEVGDVVEAGTVLASIDDADAQSELEAAEEQVSNAEEAVERATESLTEDASDDSADTSGTYADVAYPLDVTSPSPSAEQSSSSAAATTQPTATTTATSGQGGGGTSDNQGSSGEDSAVSGGDSASGGSGGSSSDSLLSAQRQLNNAKQTLTEKQSQLEGTTITAPISGKILSVQGALGDDVSSDDFIEIAGTNDVAVEVEFTEAEVAKVEVGMTSKITVSSLGDEELSGAVLQIDPAGTISDSLVRYAALITFDTVPESLLFGQSANVAVITDSVSDALYVPTTAVSGRNSDSPTVAVQVDGVVEQRVVTLGLRGDASVEILEGLSEGDVVLTSNQ